MKQYFLWFILSAGFILQGCGNDDSNSQRFRNFRSGGGERATSVETITVKQGDISSQIRSFGNIKAQDVVEVTPQVSNRITRIHADLGDTVRQDDLLAEIYEPPFRDAFEQAKAQLRQSMANYERDSLQFIQQRQLYEKDLISTTEYNNAKATFENSKAQMEASRANLTQSRENLRYTDIRSPVFGVVLARNISEGDLAGTGQVAFEIANLTGLETRVYLPLSEWEKVEVGQQVNIRVSNRNEIAAIGRVSRISPQLDPTTGLGEVVISLTEKGPSIHQGVLVESIINVETREGTVVIPRSALIENVETLIEPESNTIQLRRTYSAFVVQGDSLAQKRDLQLGIEQGDQVEVISGLLPGDEIVITGQAGLEDGAKVRVAGGQQFQNPDIPIRNAEMTDEQRNQFRERFQNADDSTRKAMRERFQQMRRQRADSPPDSSSNSPNNSSN